MLHGLQNMLVPQVKSKRLRCRGCIQNVETYIHQLTFVHGMLGRMAYWALLRQRNTCGGYPAL